MECAVGKQAAFKAESFVAPEHQQQAQQQDAMKKKKKSVRKKVLLLSKPNTISPSTQKKGEKEEEKKKAHRKGFCTFNKFAFSICSSFEKNVILFDVYSLGV